MTAKQTIGRVSRTLAAALAVAAVAAPVAVANHQDVGPRLALELRQQSHATAVRPDDRTVGPRSNPRVEDNSDALTRYLRNHLGLSGHATAVRPDDRAVGPRSNPLVQDDSDALTRYLRNHLGLSGPGVQPVHRAASVHGAIASDGFDWGDAAVGAGFGCGLLAMLGGSLVLVRHTRRRTATV